MPRPRRLIAPTTPAGVPPALLGPHSDGAGMTDCGPGMAWPPTGDRDGRRGEAMPRPRRLIAPTTPAGVPPALLGPHSDGAGMTDCGPGMAWPLQATGMVVGARPCLARGG